MQLYIQGRFKAMRATLYYDPTFYSAAGIMCQLQTIEAQET